MSRRRIGLSPKDWFDEGPSAPRNHTRPYTSVPAEPVGHMKPILTNRVVLENRTRVKVPQAFSIHPENRRERCGVIMKLAHEPCARTPGHRDCHRTAKWMRREARNRSPKAMWG